jgi:hypothetical protein
MRDPDAHMPIALPLPGMIKERKVLQGKRGQQTSLAKAQSTQRKAEKKTATAAFFAFSFASFAPLRAL